MVQRERKQRKHFFIKKNAPKEEKTEKKEEKKEKQTKNGTYGK